MPPSPPPALSPPACPHTTQSATDVDGRRRDLSEFAGRVAIVVNVASHDAFTDANYRGLRAVYDKYHEHGLEILAFPSNQVGAWV